MSWAKSSYERLGIDDPFSYDTFPDGRAGYRVAQCGQGEPRRLVTDVRDGRCSLYSTTVHTRSRHVFPVARRPRPTLHICIYRRRRRRGLDMRISGRDHAYASARAPTWATGQPVDVWAALCPAGAMSCTDRAARARSVPRATGSRRMARPHLSTAPSRYPQDDPRLSTP